MTSLFITALHGAVLALAFLAAYEDIRHLRIRNDLAITIAFLFVPMLFILPWQESLAHVLLALMVFAIGIGIYFARMMGGGDVKIIGALALWPDPHMLPHFILGISIIGGLLALIALVLKKSQVLRKLAQNPKIFGPEDGWFATLSRGESAVPYGVAIAIASTVILF